MKNEKGYTGVDIAISIVVITIFISLIALLISRFNSGANDIDLKSQATDIAIQEIENIKANGMVADTENETEQAVDGKDGFYKKIVIRDYASGDEENKVPGLVKKATVTISYNLKGRKQEVELSTILSKEF